MKEKHRVLFLCTHNAARSQMAEAPLHYHAGDRFEACSAGLEPTEVHPLTRRVLAEAGIDASGLRVKKGVSQFLGKASVQYAIVVCGEDEWQFSRLFRFVVGALGVAPGQWN